MKFLAPLLPIVAASLPGSTLAADAGSEQTVVVVGPRAADAGSLGSSDATSLLLGKPGVSAYAGGGVSALPVLRGLADDRIKIRIDGGEPTAACGNHMNAPLSYIDPTQVTSTRVLAGLTPVSAGGDNIAGVIDLSSTQPLFAREGGPLLNTGQLTVQARSVDRGITESASATLASQSLSATYTGATTHADSYEDGHGDKVRDTLYKSINQSITLGARTEDQLFVFKLGEQRIPYQGFPNEFMDMTDNHAVHAGLSWDGHFGWGALHARAFWQNTGHEMGFFTDERPGAMPMNTHGRDGSAWLEAELPTQGGTLRLGTEFHRFRLDDWWPALPGSMMMEPDTYRNIADGHRDRLGVYGEWEGRVSRRWTLNGGLRVEGVHTDAGAVHGYGCKTMCADDDAAAAAFDASDRSKRDTNVDVTLLGRFEADANASYEIGFARKTRSPGLYERYTWGRGTMAMIMTGWFGDAGGYVGDIGLKPEVANTLSATADWHDAGNASWFIRLTPFFTAVRGFIDVDPIGAYPLGMPGAPTRPLLRFANRDARLYGANLSWQAPLATDTAFGETTFSGKFDWTRGRRDDGSGGGDLYHVMPPTLVLGLAQTLRGWTGRAELQLVGRKSHVDARRQEPPTPGYALVNLGARYQFADGSSVQAGIRNLSDRQYAQPLGGVDIAAFETGAATLESVPGQGRSLDLGATWKF